LIAGFELDSRGGTAPLGQTKVTGTTIRGGISILYHLMQTQVSPYVGAEGVFQTRKNAGFFATEPDSKKSFVAGGVLGAEYFMNEKFTLGIKHVLGLEVQLSRDVPPEETDVKLATSTVVTGRFYFN
jgi:hypothetical protein